MRDITHSVLTHKITPKSKNLFLRVFLPALILAIGTITALRMSIASGTPPPPTITAAVDLYSQCSNDLGDGFSTGDTGCRWTNGNLQHNNSTYHEGDATPQRLAVKDLISGSHTVTFSYDTTKGGKHAYDFLTDDKYSETWITNSDMCDPSLSNFADCAATTPSLSLTIPTDPNAAGHDTAVSPRHFAIRNGTITNVGTPTLASGTYAGDSETTIQVTFNVDASTCADHYTVQGTPVCEVLITFGAHISTQADWGTGNSAVNISGSPYHVALVELDGSSIGQRDNQMQAGAIAQTPVITTELHNDADNSVITQGSTVPAGTSVHDKATVAKTGNSNSYPTGTVTFTFYTSSADCTNNTNGVTKGTVTLVSGVADPSTATGVLGAGTYAFKATYNSSDISTWTDATSACELFTISQGSSVTTTTLKDAGGNTVTSGGSVALGTIMHDTATVTLTPSAAPDGSVTFRFYSSDTACASDTNFSGGTVMGTVPLTGTPGVADPSSATSALGAGTYAFKANWPGNTNYQGSTSACETFTVNKAQLTVNTTAENASNTDITNSSNVPLGTVTHDVAAVTGGVNGFALPDVSFTFTTGYSDSCASGTTVANNGTENGNPKSADSSALGAGSYAYRAVVADNANYIGDTSDCEPFTVSQAQLGITTTIHDANHNPVTTVALGSIVHDTASITGQVGSITPTGAVTFTFFTSSDCTTGGTTVTTTSDTTDAVRSAASAALAAGAYSYQASVAGDTNYLGATSDCEHLTVNQFTPDITTEIHKILGQSDTVVSGPVALGSSVQDKATVTGAGITGLEPTGNVEFTFFAGDCAEPIGTFDAGTAALDGSDPGTAYPSTLEGPLNAGSYSFQAHYVGDSNYTDATSACEPLTVNTAQLGINTTVYSAANNQPLSGNLPLGGGAYDSASVTGQVGTFTLPDVTFYFFPKGVSCTNGDTTGATELNTLSPNGSGVASPSTSETALAAGTYNFMAVVASSDNYQGATSNCEPFTVDKAQLSVSTAAHDASHNDITDGSVPLGSITHDTADLTGAVDGFAVPAVSFTLTSNYSDSCADGAAVANDGIDAGNGNLKSADSSALAAGSYAYMATVAGNDNYIGGSSGCEPFSVNKANLGLTTEIHNTAEAIVTSIDAGGTVHDKATVSGLVSGIDAANNVTFTFFRGGNCDTGTPESAGSVTIVNGVAHPSDSKGPLDAGSYAFQASYDGTTDPNYNTATSDCEPLTVNKVTPDIGTTASAGGVVGVQIHDSATVTGGDNPSGTVTFYLFGPGDNCSDITTALFTETDPLSSGSAGPTANYTTLAVGTYHWEAVYSGDTNNNTVTSNCSDEAVTTTKASPGISTTPNPSSASINTVLNDSANLTGGVNPTGTITFKLYSPSDSSCSGTPAFTNVVAVSGAGTYSTSTGFTSNISGTWRWVAVYGGDTNNNQATSGCNDEQVTITAQTTRTLGFWQTHFQFTSTVYGLNQLDPIWNIDGCRQISTVNILFGGFYASIPKTTTGAKRSALDQARMQLMQQLLAAILNHLAFGSGTTVMLNTAKAAYCGTNTSTILAQVTILDTFNNSGDTQPTTLNVGKADPKASKNVANLAAWNVLP